MMMDVVAGRPWVENFTGTPGTNLYGMVLGSSLITTWTYSGPVCVGLTVTWREGPSVSQDDERGTRACSKAHGARELPGGRVEGDVDWPHRADFGAIVRIRPASNQGGNTPRLERIVLIHHDTVDSETTRIQHTTRDREPTSVRKRFGERIHRNVAIQKLFAEPNLSSHCFFQSRQFMGSQSRTKRPAHPDGTRCQRAYATC
jgi:hypothetical protein